MTLSPLQLTAVLCSILALQAGAVAAQTDAVSACSKIPGDSARLACYDSVFGRPAAADATTATAPVTAEHFGDNGQLPASRKAKAALPKTLDAQIVKVISLPQGLYRLELDNQQTWQTTQADWALDWKTGDRVTLTAMSLGGYQLSPAGNPRGVGVRRTR